MDLNYFPVTPAQPNTPDWAGFYFRATRQWIRQHTVDGSGNRERVFIARCNDQSGKRKFRIQFQAGNFVFGLGGSLAAANFDGRFTAPFLPATGAWTPNMNWLGTVTGKVGYSFGQWLPYVKGGFAAADVGSPLQGGPIGAFSQGTELNGWTAGVGVEYQFDPNGRWALNISIPTSATRRMVRRTRLAACRLRARLRCTRPP